MILETPVQAIAKQRSEAETREHDAADLEAQVRAADAAEKQISPAWAAAYLTLFGTVLLVLNLLEARRATALAREHMNTDLRAWVLPSEPSISHSTKAEIAGIKYARASAFSVSFLNQGRTPARNAGIAAQLKVAGLDAPPPSFTVRGDDQEGVIGPNQPIHSGWTAIGNPECDAFRRGEVAVFLYAHASYHTIFDHQTRETAVCYRIVCNGEEVTPEGVRGHRYEIRAVGTQRAT